MPVAFFQIAVLWDSLPIPQAYSHNSLSVLEPSWSRELEGGWERSPSPQLLPTQGAVLLTVAVPRIAPAQARALVLGSATSMGALDTDGAIGWSDRMVCIDAWDDTLLVSSLFHDSLVPWARAANTPPVLLAAVADATDVAQADGTLRLVDGRVVGTGLVEGDWDAGTFFLPSPLARPLRTAPSRIQAQAGHLHHLLAVGAVALSTGLVLGWMERRAQDSLSLPHHPIEGMDAALTPVLSACLAGQKLDAPDRLFDAQGIAQQPDSYRADPRRRALTGLGSTWKLLSRVANARERAELAEDLAFFLPRVLWMSGLWHATGAVGASTLVANPTTLATLHDRAARMGMGGALDAGLALGRTHAPHDPTILHALRGDGWI